MTVRKPIDQFGRVSAILQNAALTFDMNEKLSCLYQVRELIINFDRSLLNVFFDDVITFHMCKNSDLKLFVVKFIEDCCLLDPSLVSKSIVSLSHLYFSCLHAEPPSTSIIHSIVESMKIIYSHSWAQAVNLGMIESGVSTCGGIEADSLAYISLKNFHIVAAFRNEIFRLLIPLSISHISDTAIQSQATMVRLCSNMSNKVRISIVKFIEFVIIQQCFRPLGANAASISKEFALDRVPILKEFKPLAAIGGVSAMRPSHLLEEAQYLFLGLKNLALGSEVGRGFRHIMTNSVFEALLDTFVNIARQCPEFFGEIVNFYECILANLPAHFNKFNLNSAKKKLRSTLLSLYQLSSQVESICGSRIFTLISGLGVTQDEIPLAVTSPMCLPEYSNKRACLDFHSSLPFRDELDMSSKSKRPRPAANTSPEDNGSFTLEVIASHIASKLNNGNVVDLVILSMANLPTSLPPDFKSRYSLLASPRGSNFCRRHLSGLLATLLVSWAGTGDQIESPSRIISNFYNINSAQQDVFNVDELIQPLSSYRRRAFMMDAFERILSFNPRSGGLETQIRCSDLEAKDAARSKILLRLALRAPRSIDLYKFLIEHIMSKLEDNFDLLMSLLTHEYCQLKKPRIVEVSNGIRKNGELASNTKGLGDIEGNEVNRICSLEEEQKSSMIPSLQFQSDSHSYDNLFNEILGQISKLDIKKPYMCRFFLEAPVLTTGVISFLKNYCAVPDQSEYGFQVVRTLIEMKPTQWREELLNLLFGFSAFEQPIVRDAAIKATCQLANSSAKWEEVVEDRAVERMKRILQPKPTIEMFADLFVKPPTLTDKWTNETCKLCAQLFLGLLPRNPGKLLSSLAEMYVAASDTVRLFILQHLDTSMCEIGLQSPHFLHLLDSCPIGAESLITRMLRVLTDPRKVASSAHTEPIMPPQDVVDRMRRLYRERANDVRFIIPVVVGLSKQEVIELLPRILQLNDAYVKEVITRLLRASVATQPPPDPKNPDGETGLSYKDSILGPVTPEDLLVAIHLLEFAKDPNATPEDPPPTKPYVEIRVILQACMHCFAERSLYTQERLSAAIGQLLDCPVVPKLFLRTVMQALALYPRLSGYVINVLFRLIQKQVWKTDVLWDGFIRCCVKTQPQSYQVLLQLPPQQLQSVFKREPDLRTQLRRYVDNFSSAQRTHISRGVYEVLEREDTPEVSTKAPEESSQPVSGGTEGTPVIKVGHPEADAQSSGAATPVCDEIDEGTKEKTENREESSNEKPVTAFD